LCIKTNNQTILAFIYLFTLGDTQKYIHSFNLRFFLKKKSHLTRGLITNSSISTIHCWSIHNFFWAPHVLAAEIELQISSNRGSIPPICICLGERKKERTKKSQKKNNNNLLLFTPYSFSNNWSNKRKELKRRFSYCFLKYIIFFLKFIFNINTSK
jgi:hypothetical protein